MYQHFGCILGYGVTGMIPSGTGESADTPFSGLVISMYPGIGAIVSNSANSQAL